jgi:L-rhamnose mutarotase
MTRLFYALDLQDDPALIDEYERWHQADRVWPDILRSLRAAGIEEAEIFRTGNRLVLVMDVSPGFDPAAKAAADAADSRVQAWETLMWNYQKALPWARPGEKWVPMRRIFSLTDALRNVNTLTHVKDHTSP